MSSYTGAQFLQWPLPPLAVSGPEHRVNQPSSSNYPPYPGEIRDWPNFVRTVKAFCHSHPPDHFELSKDGPDATINKEVFLVAQEKSVEGRFTDHVMHVVEHCAHASRLTVRLADFKAADKARPEGKQPDWACITRDGKNHLRFIGECKADFNNNLLKNYNQSLELDFEISGRIRKWLQQPLTYLVQFNLKFGFVTTYNYTMFICLPTHVHSETPLEYDRVYITKPIPHNARVTEGTVTVRQAMWYLTNQSQASHESRPRGLDSSAKVSHTTSIRMFRDAPKDHLLPPGADPNQGSSGRGVPPTPGPGPNVNTASMQTAPVYWNDRKLSNGGRTRILTLKWEKQDYPLPPQNIRQVTTRDGKEFFVGEVVVNTRKGPQKERFRLKPGGDVDRKGMDNYLAVRQLAIRTNRP